MKPSRENLEPKIRVNVDPTNPGQFFACCGLLELADRLAPGTEGWFAKDRFELRCDRHFGEVLGVLQKSSVTNTMSAAENLMRGSSRISRGISEENDNPYLSSKS